MSYNRIPDCVPEYYRQLEEESEEDYQRERLEKSDEYYAQMEREELLNEYGIDVEELEDLDSADEIEDNESDGTFEELDLELPF